MPITATVEYSGNLRTSAVHTASGSSIETDAPVDNHGRGERFSPTDLVAAALASCMCTVMGIVAERKGWDLRGLRCDVQKIMAAEPRRIGELVVALHFPDSLSLPSADRKLLEHTAMTCPVLESLSSDLKKSVSFHWPAADDA